MKRQRLFVVSVLSAFLVALGWTPLANAYENEPIGFDDLEWGSTASDDMTYVAEDPMTFAQTYTRSTDTMMLGGVPVSEIRYEFDFRRLLDRVVLTGVGQAHYDALNKYLRASHGEPDEAVAGLMDNRSVWNGSTTTIQIVLKKYADPLAFEVVYSGTAVVKSARKELDAALGFLDQLETEGDEVEKEEEEDPFGDLFD